MKPVSLNDYYRCKRCYGGVDIDFASLTDFYLPLVGASGYASYLALIREDDATHAHTELLPLLGLTAGEFEKGITALEAVGLVRTFIAKEGALNLFVYCLYAPLHAQEFDRDIMLSGTVKGRFGMDAYAKLLARHQGSKAMEDMEEVSVSFPEFFKPSFDAKFYLSASSSESSQAKAMAKTGFDRVALLRHLEEMGLRKNALSEEELVKIGQIASLYSIHEPLLGELCFDCIRPNQPLGKKLNVEELSSRCYAATCVPALQEDKGDSSQVSDDTETARMIRMMDELPPAKFLKVMQKNHNPAKVDLRLLEHLQLDLGLPNPCVNALVFYTLSKQGNTLPAPYCEKLAAAMVREGCRSARDAMDYLHRTGKRKRRPKDVMPGGATPKKPAPVETVGDEEVSDEAVDAALKDLFGD